MNVKVIGRMYKIGNCSKPNACYPEGAKLMLRQQRRKCQNTFQFKSTSLPGQCA